MLFLSAQTYRIVNESTGEVTNEGISLRYIPSDNLEPAIDETAANRGQVSKGHKVAKVSLPIAKLNKCHNFPAFYNASMKFSVVGDKQQIQITDIDYLGDAVLMMDEPKQAK